MKLIKYWPYRQSIGSVKQATPIEQGEVMAALLHNLANTSVDNHTGFVISLYGKERGYYWSDGDLTEVTRFVAGDCNREFPVLTVLWEKK